MNFTFVCQNCDDSFEVDYETITGGRGLKCEECGKRLPAGDVEELVTSLDELLGRVASMRKRFGVTFEIDSDDLPAAFETETRRAASEDDEDDDESSEEDDDLDDDSDDEDSDEEDDRY